MHIPFRRAYGAKLRIFIGVGFHPAKEYSLPECFGPGIVESSVNSELMIEVRLFQQQASHCLILQRERIVSLGLRYLIDTLDSLCCIAGSPLSHHKMHSAPFFWG